MTGLAIKWRALKGKSDKVKNAIVIRKEDTTLIVAYYKNMECNWFPVMDKILIQDLFVRICSKNTM